MLKRLLVGFAVAVALVIVVGSILPAEVHVERSVVIQAPPEAVYPHLNNFERFNAWSPWAGRDPDTQYTFTGPESGVGHKMTWQSDHPEVGSGHQEIIETDPPSYQKSELNFGPQGTAYATFTLDQAEGGTRVTWGLDTDIGWDIVGRYFGLMFDSMIGPDYERGLASLKEIVEGEQAAAAEEGEAVANEDEDASTTGNETEAPGSVSGAR